MSIALRYIYIGAYMIMMIMFTGVMVDLTFQSDYDGPVHWFWFMYVVAMISTFDMLREDRRYIKENTGA